MEIKKINKVILLNLVFSNQINIDLRRIAHYQSKGAPEIDYKNIKLLKDTYQKMVKSYHQE